MTKFSKPIFLLNKFSFKDSVFSLAIRKSRCQIAFPNHQSVFTNSVMEYLDHTAELKAVFPSVMDGIRTLLGLLLGFSSIVTLACFHLPSNAPCIFKTNGESPFRVQRKEHYSAHSTAHRRWNAGYR